MAAHVAAFGMQFSDEDVRRGLLTGDVQAARGRSGHMDAVVEWLLDNGTPLD